MFWITRNNLLSVNVVHFVLKDFLSEQINKRLDAHGHFGGIWLISVISLKKLRKVKRGVSHLEALNIELGVEEKADVLNQLCLAEVLPDLISELKDCSNNFFLVIHIKFDTFFVILLLIFLVDV